MLCWMLMQKISFADYSNGDARNALNALELGVLTTCHEDKDTYHVGCGIRVHSAKSHKI